jgi:hypothetical protein
VGVHRRGRISGCLWLLAGIAIQVGLLLGPATIAEAAVLTVTTNDGGPPVVDGQCSLREAIRNARLNALTHADCPVAGQAAPAVDEIRFNIGGGGPQSIALASALDTLTGGPLLLDATTQPGPGALPLITLDGAGAGAGVSGFEATGADVTIRGFAIVNFAGNGILVNAGAQRTIVEGNHVGIDRLGQSAQANADGISLTLAVRSLELAADSTAHGGVTPRGGQDGRAPRKRS